MIKKDQDKLVFAIAGIILVVVVLWGIGGFQMPTGSVSENTESPSATQSSRTVSSVIASIEYGSRFSQLLSSTGVGSTLTGKGPFTIFVSTDGAFGRLTPGTINNLSAAEQKRVVQYHVVVGRKLDADALKSGHIQALSRDTLNFQVGNDGEIYVNSGKVLETYNASNGIVYVINAVLLPPKPLQ